MSYEEYIHNIEKLNHQFRKDQRRLERRMAFITGNGWAIGLPSHFTIWKNP